MDLGLQGRVALVMGGSRGLGRAIGGVLAAEGARVALASRSRERIEAAAAEIGGEAAAFVADATDLDRLAELPGEVEETLGLAAAAAQVHVGDEQRAEPADISLRHDHSTRMVAIDMGTQVANWGLDHNFQST